MPANASFSKPTILVVDDDLSLNLLLCSFLEEQGFNLVSAYGVGDAKKILQSNSSLDLLLLDYHLGDGVGMDLLEPEMLASYCKSVPVIMISANEEPEFLQHCFARGVSDYIIKPINLSLLALKVDALIKSIKMQHVIAAQNSELEAFKRDAEREEQIAKSTYDYLLRQYSSPHQGIDIWLKSFAAFSGDMALTQKSPGGSLFFMLADATGHGLAAAITIMPVLTIFNSMVGKGFQVQQIVTELNRKLVSDTPVERFVAASLVEVNPFQREINVWNGGMPSVYWVDKGKVLHEFSSTHMALGILEDDIFDCSVETISLPDSGFLLAHSDGLNEQENAQGAPFTTARILQWVAQQPQDLLPTLAADLQTHVGCDSYDDDVSICAINPGMVFNHDLHNQAGRIAESHIAPFSWQLSLSGENLRRCDIPPLCNHFLQSIGYDQLKRQKVFSIVAEMLSNAIDHGILKLSSALKETPDGFMEYFAERQRRMEKLRDTDVVVLTLIWNSPAARNRLIIEVEDSGEGYDIGSGAEAALEQLSGRGSALIQCLSESVEVFAPGNKIRAQVD
ncbi:MAG TPA: SpoIIE family protein phosphatase [Cellvibrio sp.]|nr:SpoIIE family protein phosphatase [Cellvibrio sp.]